MYPLYSVVYCVLSSVCVCEYVCAWLNFVYRVCTNEISQIPIHLCILCIVLCVLCIAVYSLQCVCEWLEFMYRVYTSEISDSYRDLCMTN